MSVPRPLRALFVNENIGGHATVHRALRAVLADRDDVQAEFLDVPEPGLLARVARLPIPPLAGLDLDLQPLRGQLVRSRWVRRALHERLRRGGVDVLHVYTQNAALLSAPHMQTVPTVVSTDSTNELNAYRIAYRAPTRFTRLSLRPSLPLERRVFAAARRVVANSDFVAASLRATYAVPPDRLRVLPFGVHLPPPPPARPSRRPTVVFVGHQLERKGGHRLLALHARHLREICDLTLVTTETVEVGPGVKVVSDVTAGSGRLWEVLAEADVMCFPSTIDQAPNAVLEAAAAGLPVVAHPVGAVPEMVLHGHSGLLVPPADDAALVHALRLLVQDADLRRDMGARARAHVEERYDMRQVADRLVPLLAEAVAEARPR